MRDGDLVRVQQRLRIRRDLRRVRGDSDRCEGTCTDGSCTEVACTSTPSDGGVAMGCGPTPDAAPTPDAFATPDATPRLDAAPVVPQR